LQDGDVVVAGYFLGFPTNCTDARWPVRQARAELLGFVAI